VAWIWGGEEVGVGRIKVRSFAHINKQPNWPCGQCIHFSCLKLGFKSRWITKIFCNIKVTFLKKWTLYTKSKFLFERTSHKHYIEVTFQKNKRYTMYWSYCLKKNSAIPSLKVTFWKKWTPCAISKSNLEEKNSMYSICYVKATFCAAFFMYMFSYIRSCVFFFLCMYIHVRVQTCSWKGTFMHRYIHVHVC